jgi:hypothetical protein
VAGLWTSAAALHAHLTSRMHYSLTLGKSVGSLVLHAINSPRGRAVGCLCSLLCHAGLSQHLCAPHSLLLPIPVTSIQM